MILPTSHLRSVALKSTNNVPKFSPELREMIFKIVLTTWTGTAHSLIAALRLDPQLYSEAMWILTKQAPFAISSRNLQDSLLMPSHPWSHIRSLLVEHDNPSHDSVGPLQPKIGRALWGMTGKEPIGIQKLLNQKLPPGCADYVHFHELGLPWRTILGAFKSPMTPHWTALICNRRRAKTSSHDTMRYTGRTWVNHGRSELRLDENWIGA